MRIVMIWVHWVTSWHVSEVRSLAREAKVWRESAQAQTHSFVSIATSTLLKAQLELPRLLISVRKLVETFFFA